MKRRGLAVIVPLLLALALPAVAQEPDAGAEVAAPEQDERFTKLLEALTTDDSFKVRLQAAVFLGRSGNDAAVEPLIKSLVGDEHYTVRAAAATGLANLQVTTAIAEIVKAAAVDTDDFVREEAGRALRKFDRDEALPYVVATYGSDDSRVRTEVVRYLAEGTFEAAEVVLLRALGDETEIMNVALGAVQRMETSERLRFLTTAVEHRDPGVRRGTIEVLHKEGTQQATDVILKVYDRDIEVDQVRTATRAALRDLRRFLPVPQIVEDARANPDKHVRARALKLLGVIGGTEAQGALVSTLTDKEVYLRGTAVMALRELGNPATIPELEKLLRDPSNQRIALQIRTAVKHLRKRKGASSP